MNEQNKANKIKKVKIISVAVIRKAMQFYYKTRVQKELTLRVSVKAGKV